MNYLASTPEQLGLIIAGFRKKHNLSQRELGFFVGLSQSAVSEIETNPGKTSVSRLFRLLSGLQLDLLLTERENPLIEAYRKGFVQDSPEPEW